jgi:hypothetical protein
MNSHPYSFKVTVADKLYTTVYSRRLYLKLKLQQLINTIELVINLIFLKSLCICYIF